MKKFELKKYSDNQLDETHTIPVAFVSILTTILPTSAMDALKESGFDFQTLIEASKQGQSYHSSTMVSEKGVMKKIVIDLL